MIDKPPILWYAFIRKKQTFEAKIKPEGAPQESGGSWKPAEGPPANGSLRERGTEAASDDASQYPDRELALRAEDVLASS